VGRRRRPAGDRPADQLPGQREHRGRARGVPAPQRHRRLPHAVPADRPAAHVPVDRGRDLRRAGRRAVCRDVVVVASVHREGSTLMTSSVRTQAETRARVGTLDLLWLTWRQHRWAIVSGAVFVVALGGYILWNERG